jgi:hypothetical protein
MQNIEPTQAVVQAVENTGAPTDNRNESDNGVHLAQILSPYFRPEEQIIVCGALDIDKVSALAKEGGELVLNMQDAELTLMRPWFKKQVWLMSNSPLQAQRTKQLNMLAFDECASVPQRKKLRCIVVQVTESGQLLLTCWLDANGTAGARVQCGLTESLSGNA